MHIFVYPGEFTIYININIFSILTLDGKNVFQCFWSDPKTCVFECFGVSPPPSPRVFFNVFGIGQTHVFFTVFLRLCTVLFAI